MKAMRVPSGDHEGDGFIPFAVRQPLQLLRRDVEKIDVTVTAREQIALPVLFEFVAIDQDRLRRFRLAAPLSVAASAASASGSGSPTTSASRFESGDHS